MTPPPPSGAAALHADGGLEKKRVVAAARTVILVGNPNVGKSVLFGALTGKYVTVSNYPGTTVDVESGLARLHGACPNRMDSPAFHYDFAEVEQIQIVVHYQYLCFCVHRTLFLTDH